MKDNENMNTSEVRSNATGRVARRKNRSGCGLETPLAATQTFGLQLELLCFQKKNYINSMKTDRNSNSDNDGRQQ